MKKLDVPQSGSAADIVASRNRFGQYNRTRATPVQPRTDRQVYIRGLMSDASQAWRSLTDELRAAWNAYASVTPSVDALGQTVYPTGHQRFVGAYTAADNAGLAIPPDVPTDAPSAAPLLSAYEVEAGGNIQFTVDTVASATKVLVIEGAPPTSPGVTFQGDYRFLAALASTPLGVANVTAPWTAKFGTLSAGRRVSFRAYWVTPTGGKGLPGVITGVSVAA